MIYIKNTQKKIPLDNKKIKSYINQILKIINFTNFDVSIWFTTNATIKKYNKTYRNKDKATDILSFPFWPELKPREKIKAISPDEQNLGDIIISLEYAQKDALESNITLDKRLKVLLVHGICHLIGYDHITDQDYKKMHAKELSILKKL